MSGRDLARFLDKLNWFEFRVVSRVLSPLPKTWGPPTPLLSNTCGSGGVCTAAKRVTTNRPEIAEPDGCWDLPVVIDESCSLCSDDRAVAHKRCTPCVGSATVGTCSSTGSEEPMAIVAGRARNVHMFLQVWTFIVAVCQPRPFSVATGGFLAGCAQRNSCSRSRRLHPLRSTCPVQSVRRCSLDTCGQVCTRRTLSGRTLQTVGWLRIISLCGAERRWCACRLQDNTLQCTWLKERTERLQC